MKDNDIRGLVLSEFYERRDETLVNLYRENFGDQFSYETLQRICRQLVDYGLIAKWHPIVTAGNQIGLGQITAAGVDVMEGKRESPIAIEVHQHTHDYRGVNVTSSHNVQIGSNNAQSVTVHVEGLLHALNSSTLNEADKQRAKSLLATVLEHPLLVAAFGTGLGALLGS